MIPGPPLLKEAARVGEQTPTPSPRSPLRALHVGPNLNAMNGSDGCVLRDLSPKRSLPALPTPSAKNRFLALPGVHCFGRAQLKSLHHGEMQTETLPRRLFGPR